MLKSILTVTKFSQSLKKQKRRWFNIYISIYFAIAIPQYAKWREHTVYYLQPIIHELQNDQSNPHPHDLVIFQFN